VYKDREDKMECRNNETVKEKGKEKGKSTNERNVEEGKSEKEGRSKRKLQFSPITHHK